MLIAPAGSRAGNGAFIRFVRDASLLIGRWAQMTLHSAFGKHSRAPGEEVEGQLTAPYDPAKRARLLSSGSFNPNSEAVR